MAFLPLRQARGPMPAAKRSRLLASQKMSRRAPSLLVLPVVAAAVLLLLYTHDVAWTTVPTHLRTEQQPQQRHLPLCAPPAAEVNFSQSPLDYRQVFKSSKSLELVSRLSAGCSWGGRVDSSRHTDMRIPPILHFVHLPNADRLIQMAATPDASFHLEWAQSCMKMYPSFQHLYWDHGASRKLLEMYYPTFLGMFDAFPFDMQRADSIRYFIMHRIGGIYFDADVLCYRPALDMLAGADIVLQGTESPEFLASAVLASVPGHPFWMHTVEVLTRRFEQFKNELGHVLDLTGPFMLRDALKEYLFGSEAEDLNDKVAGGAYEAPRPPSSDHRSVVRIHPRGTYFTPCAWADQDCHKKMAANQRFGTVPSHLAGYHLYRGSWWGTAEGNPNSNDDNVGDGTGGGM